MFGALNHIQFAFQMASDWYNYVLQFDKMLAEALLTCARNSMNNVYFSLRSEGDISPAPLIIIMADVENQKVTLQPTMDTIDQLMKTMHERVFRSLNRIPRIADKLNLPPDYIGPAFAQLMQTDLLIEETKEKICLEIAYNKEEIDEFLLRWCVFDSLWMMTEEEFVKQMAESKQTGDVFESSIESYSSMAELIATKNAVENVYFLMVNQTLLKNTLMDYIEKWQLLNVKLLTKKASSRIKSK